MYWNVRSDRGSHPVPDHSGKNTPGDCTFGPSLSFIGVKFDGPICPEWVHQEEAATPPNLYLAQLARRQGRPANGAAAAQRR